ncbi:hypothetical protein OS493_038777 [Desmophyllum pertusum]|uniref:Glutamate synthase central-N domain-containing protein n=1 Tax=Desmophyllum pertusum TaxID=174260 RepID=A0A9W9ZHG8_9CNID|nr:hypothetical protein OS493_038777 [Desmophyllum pertusum]
MCSNFPSSCLSVQKPLTWCTRWKRESVVFVPSLDRICKEASEAVENGCAFIVLTDRAAGRNNVPMSSLLSLGCCPSSPDQNENKGHRSDWSLSQLK